jgi:hypothetical protein
MAPTAVAPIPAVLAAPVAVAVDSAAARRCRRSTKKMRTIYTALNIDPRTAGQCARRQIGAAAGTQASAGGSARSQGGQGGQGALTPSPDDLATHASAHRSRVRVGQPSCTSRRASCNAAKATSITRKSSGLKEGERVVMLGALALQAQRQGAAGPASSERQPRLADRRRLAGPGAGGPRRWWWWKAVVAVVVAGAEAD